MPRTRRPKTVLAAERLEDRLTPTAFKVTNVNDSGAGSLRSAIGLANTDVGRGPEIIVFDDNVRGQTINLTTFVNPDGSTPAVTQPAGASAFVVTSDITIRRSGQVLLQHSESTFRLFQVTKNANLRLQNLTLSGGNARGGDGQLRGGGGAGMGGAIYNQGGLVIENYTLVGNSAIGGGHGSDGHGGGGMGGPPSDVHNSGGRPNPGTNDQSPGFGGGGVREPDGTPQPGGYGGGGASGNPYLNDEDTDGPQKPGGPGGFGGGGDGGNESANSDGAGGPGGFGGKGGSGGYGRAGGGAGLGGAIFNQEGTVLIENSTISGNTARGGNATAPPEFGVREGPQAGAGAGGALFNLNGTVTLINDTITANTVAPGSGVVANQAYGAGVCSARVDAGLNSGATAAVVSLTNCILANSVGAVDLESFQVAGSTGSASVV